MESGAGFKDFFDSCKGNPCGCPSWACGSGVVSPPDKGDLGGCLYIGGGPVILKSTIKIPTANPATA